MTLSKDICLFVMSIALVFAILSSPADAQTKRRKTPVTKNPTVTAAPPTSEPKPQEPVVEKIEPKKNERPATVGPASEKTAAKPMAADPTYFYEFTQPNFTISKLVIEHDDAGRGTLTFTKKLFAETISDPLQVSPAALERINAAYAALNFLESTESYQYEKDYSHLGVSTFRLKKGGKERRVVFNYSVIPDAKALADEYRRIGNQFIWIFDITVARENQPLESPKLLDLLESLMKRNELSDATQLLPLLKSLTDDERIPLIARNHAAKIVGKINGKR